MNNFNPMILNMFKNGNPQQIAMNMLQKQAGNNPIMRNVLDMVNSNDMNGIEQIVRNVCQSKGLDADEMYLNVQQQFH